jgi:hypothetical protein
MVDVSIDDILHEKQGIFQEELAESHRDFVFDQQKKSVLKSIIIKAHAAPSFFG